MRTVSGAGGALSQGFVISLSDGDSNPHPYTVALYTVSNSALSYKA